MSKMELSAAIRRDARAGLGAGDRTQVSPGSAQHRSGVVLGLAAAARRKPAPRDSQLDPFKPVIDAILRVNLDAPRKRRHTVQRIVNRLLAEHGMSGRPIRWCAPTSPPANPRFVSRPASVAKVIGFSRQLRSKPTNIRGRFSPSWSL